MPHSLLLMPSSFYQLSSMLLSVPVEETFVKGLFIMVCTGSRQTKKGWHIAPGLEARGHSPPRPEEQERERLWKAEGSSPVERDAFVRGVRPAQLTW